MNSGICILVDLLIIIRGCLVDKPWRRLCPLLLVPEKVGAVCSAMLWLGTYYLVLSIQYCDRQIKPDVEYNVKNRFVNREGPIPKGEDAINGCDGDFFDAIASK